MTNSYANKLKLTEVIIVNIFEQIKSNIKCAVSSSDIIKYLLKLEYRSSTKTPSICRNDQK